MLKRILSVIAGASAGILIVIAGDMATHFFFPIPEGIAHNDKEALREMLTLIPTSALIIMMAFWLLSSFIGAFVAAKINKQSWRSSAIITGSVLMTAAILNMLIIAHPIWMMITTILFYIPVAYLGGKLAS